MTFDLGLCVGALPADGATSSSRSSSRHPDGGGRLVHALLLRLILNSSVGNLHCITFRLLSFMCKIHHSVEDSLYDGEQKVFFLFSLRDGLVVNSRRMWVQFQLRVCTLSQCLWAFSSFFPLSKDMNIRLIDFHSV